MAINFHGDRFPNVVTFILPYWTFVQRDDYNLLQGICADELHS